MNFNGRQMTVGTDLATREIVKRRIRAVREELEALIERTAMSPVIREKKDFFVAFFDVEGRLITGTEFPLGANAIEPILRHFPVESMSHGDLYIYNDPYSSDGGVSHVPDMVVASPVIVDGRPVGFVEAFGHLWDVGGSVSGSISPTAVDIHSEGILVPPVRLRRAKGVLDDALVRLLSANSRYPEYLVGDLRALIASVDLGSQRLVEIIDSFGADTYLKVKDAILEEGRIAAATMWEQLGTSDTTFVEAIEDGFGTGERHSISLRLLTRDGGASLDLTGTSDQSRAPINFPMHESVIGMMFGMYFLDPSSSVGLSAGFLDTIDECVFREQSLLRPAKPAPVGMRGITWIHTHSAVLGALGRATDGQAPAASATYVIYYLRGESSDDPFFLMDGVGVGYGAKPWGDGLDGIYYVAQKNFPNEFLESRWPVRIESYGLAPDSGGAGRYRGGLGIRKRVRVLRDKVSLVCRLDNRELPAWGAAGGKAGATGAVDVWRAGDGSRESVVLGSSVILNEGDVLELSTPGGGGWGDPLERPIEEVLRDLRNGWVSPSAARELYGVHVDSAALDVDVEATARARRS